MIINLIDNILCFLLITIILCLIIPFASLLLGNKSPDKEKVSVYECGFDPFYTLGEPFSIKFFLIAILFLVFDLEIAYLFPWATSSNLISLKGHYIVYLFIIILILGLIYEWVMGGLEWE
uniref:NADH-ubiquinone oxidoreductase chain 3 n=1 Tax=Plotocnide borealis TaxID=1755686 RepID=A0A0S2IC71_9CNID|nr:NADH dehydrogenase subunit 3 [Plotocnide borealis]